MSAFSDMTASPPPHTNYSKAISNGMAFGNRTDGDIYIYNIKKSIFFYNTLKKVLFFFVTVCRQATEDPSTARVVVAVAIIPHLMDFCGSPPFGFSFFLQTFSFKVKFYDPNIGKDLNAPDCILYVCICICQLAFNNKVLST